MTVKQLKLRYAKTLDIVGLGTLKADSIVAVLKNMLRLRKDPLDAKHTIRACNELLQKNNTRVQREWLWFKGVNAVL